MSLESRSRLVKKGEAAYDVYIGRGSPFGNPFVIGRHGSRAAVIAQYAKWLETGDNSGNPMATEEARQAVYNLLPTLKGQVMACFCAPALACHGQVLLDLLRKEGIE